MKILMLIVLLTGHLGIAQVNLDRAYLGKTGNTLFYDINDQNLIWVIPKYLDATSANDILQIGSEYRVRYNVSLPEQTLVDLAPQAGSPLRFRAFRATQVTLEQLTDVDPRLKPNIIPLGDIGMFGETISYNISIQSRYYPNTAKNLTKHLFDGKRSFLLGRVFYYFSAIRSGQLFQAQSVVAILTPKKTPISKVKIKVAALEDSSFDQNKFKSSHFKIEFLLEPQGHPHPPLKYVTHSELQFDTQAYNPQILFNSQSGCWNKGTENVICLND